MLPKITNYQKFKKEIAEYRAAIDKIKNDKIKEEYNKLLSVLLSESKIIDQTHDAVSNNDIDPRKIRENIEKMMDIRIKLQKVVKDSKDY